jgi:putative endonuclease
MRSPGAKTARQRAGSAAEDLAERFLRRHGLAIVERNFRCKGGEIDLVARDGDAIVFVEVRLRRSGSHGGATASVDAAKQRRVLHAARVYLAGRGDAPCRCDVVALDGLDPARIDWIRNAFGE